MRQHIIAFQRDKKYNHLFRPICSCGWQKQGFFRYDQALNFSIKHNDQNKDK